MLSILIPIYNEDVISLVESLVRQGRGLLEFEILCFDDGSKESYHQANKILEKYPSYVEKILYKSIQKMKHVSEKKIIDYVLISCQKISCAKVINVSVFLLLQKSLYL